MTHWRAGTLVKFRGVHKNAKQKLQCKLYPTHGKLNLYILITIIIHVYTAFFRKKNPQIYIDWQRTKLIIKREKIGDKKHYRDIEYKKKLEETAEYIKQF